jgi:hypothetical protein
MGFIQTVTIGTTHPLDLPSCIVVDSLERSKPQNYRPHAGTKATDFPLQ